MLPSQLHPHLPAARRDDLLREARRVALAAEARVAHAAAWDRTLDAVVALLLAASRWLEASRARGQPARLVASVPVAHAPHHHHLHAHPHHHHHAHHHGAHGPHGHHAPLGDAA